VRSAKGGEAIEPFRVEVPDEALDDLRRRLAATRWPAPEPVADWSQGVPVAYLRDLCAYWGGEYDWRRGEGRLNALPQFRTVIDGVGIHFIHLRSPHPEALPLVMSHGWPGSVLEFLDAAPALVDPTAHGGEASDAFHLVIPALPGFGWSDAPSEVGWGPSRIGRAWAELMERLGYERYGAQGGDWGSAVSRAVGRAAPDRVVGIHLNSDHVERAVVARLGAEDEFERFALARRESFNRDGRGYSRQQATRPQTLAPALADSPAGQCAWIVEKFAAWSDGDGDPERAFSRDALLDNVSLYWLTNSAASSARIYWETAQEPAPFDAGGVPVALSTFPRDIHPIPERWARAQEPNLVYFNRLARGGHFAALEAPGVFVEEVRAGFRAIRAA
jgi:epoxide hydrolase